MSDVFSVLANPVRRRLLETLRDGPRAVTDLASRFDLGRPAISEHLQVLRQAGLVTEEPRGRHRYYHLRADPLAEVDAWLHPFEHFWRTRMRSLRDVLDETVETEKEDEIWAPPSNATSSSATRRPPSGRR